MGIDLPVIWAVIIGLRADDVRGDGRFRPWNRHPLFRSFRDRAIATTMVEHGCAGLGRQRDLAGPGGPR